MVLSVLKLSHHGRAEQLRSIGAAHDEVGLRPIGHNQGLLGFIGEMRRRPRGPLGPNAAVAVGQSGSHLWCGGSESGLFPDADRLARLQRLTGISSSGQPCVVGTTRDTRNGGCLVPSEAKL